MLNTTFSKYRTSFQKIGRRFGIALGLTLAWLFALMLLGNLGQVAHTSSAVAALQEPSLVMGRQSQLQSFTSAEVLSETAPLAKVTRSQAELQNALALELCDDPISLTVESLVSNQPSSSDTGNELVFWSTGELDLDPNADNSDGNLEIFWGKAGVVNNQETFQFTQVTSSTGSILGGFNLAPVISADGEYIAFFSDRNLTEENKDENFELFWAKLNKKTRKVISLVQVTKSVGGSNILPSISDEGDRIAFVSDRNLSGLNADENPEIFVATINITTNKLITVTEVTSTTEEVINDEAVISGDGKAVAFTRDGKLYFARRIDSGYESAIPLTKSSPDITNEQPAISNETDGYYHIAFVSHETNTPTLNIWLAKVASDNDVTVEQITNASDASSEQPSISADGVRIAFASNGNFTGGNPGKKSQIFVYDSVSDSFRQLTPEQLGREANNQPSISLNGTQVAFISQGTLYQSRCPFTDLEVQVTALKEGKATAGEGFTYSLTATNHGPLRATDVKLTETVPVNTVFNKKKSSGEWSCAHQSPAGTVCELVIGVLDTYPISKQFDFAVTVLSNVLSGTKLTNSVGIQGGELDRQPTNNSDTLSDTTVIRNTELSIDTTVTTVFTGQVKPGEKLTYALAIKNTGTSDATNVYITDSVPLSTTFNPNENDGEFNSALRLVTWEPFTVSANSTEIRSLILELETPVLAGVEMLTNTVDGFARDDEEMINRHTLATTVKAEPQLQLSLNDGTVIPKPGGTHTYTLTYINNGNQEAIDVMLTETVPLNTTFNEQSSTEGWSCDDQSAAGTDCTFSIEALRGGGSNGQVLFAVTVDNPVPAGAHTITNTAQIDDNHENGVDPKPNNNNNTISTILDAEPDLTVTKHDGGVIPIPNTANDTITYTLTYTNNGDQGATGVVLTEIVPDHTTVTGDNWNCSNGTCTFERLNELPGGGTIGTIGSSDTITFAVRVDYPLAAGVDDVTNSVSIADDDNNGTDNNPVDNESPEVTTVVNAAPNLRVTKTDNHSLVEPSDEISYVLTYTNIGNQNTTDVVLRETIPANTSFNSSANVDGWTCEQKFSGNPCLIELTGTLAVSESDSVIFPVTVLDPVPFGVESITNTASITDTAVNGTDLDPDNNQTTDTNTLFAVPLLELTIDDGGMTAHPSDTIVYSLNYTNAGNQEAINVVLSETIPANSTFNEAASHPDWEGCADNSQPGTNCTFDVGSLKGLGGIGNAGSITFAVTVDYPVASGVMEINNHARIADNNDNNPLSSATDSSTTPVEAQPELQLSKDDHDDRVEPSDVIRYTLTYTNAGNQDTIGVVITETVPTNTSFHQPTSTSGWSCPNSLAGTECSFNVGALSGEGTIGESGTITFAVKVINPVPTGEIQIANTATITDIAVNGADLVPSNNHDDDTNELDAAPDLQLSIDDGGITATPDHHIVYTLTYTNAGNQEATGIVITETLPDETIFNPGASHPDWDCQGNTCTYDVGSLPGGSTIDSTGMVSFTVTVTESIEAGTIQITNSASIADNGSNGADDDPTDNTRTKTTPVTAEPLLELAISDGVTNVFANDLITYTLIITNSGNQAARNIVLTDRLPISTTFQSATGNGQHNNHVVTWTIPLLPGGHTTVIRSVTARVDPNLAAGRHELENLAGVIDDGQNSNTIGLPITASASDTNTARSAFMAITPANQTVNEGDTFNVTVQVAAGNLNINQLFAYLNFNPTYLEVTALNSVLPTITANFNNTTGEINFVTTDNQTAPFSTGSFNLVEIQFEALADSPNTSLSFNTAASRNTSVKADGLTDRFLTDETGATVRIQDFTLTLTPDSLTVCKNQNRTTTVNLTAINGFDDAVTLATVPANTMVTFSANSVIPPGNSTVTIAPTAAAALGTYNVHIVGSVGGLQHSDTLSLQIQDVPGSVTLNPLNNNSTRPTFSWQPALAANSYDIQIATDAAFNNIVRQSNLTTTSYTPSTALEASTTYFWRVRANNGCGNVLSASSSFTTHQFTLSATPSSQNICRNLNSDDYTITMQPLLGFNDDVMLTVQRPTGSNATFDTNPVTTADDTSILTISNINQVSVGSHTINIHGTADGDGLQRSISVTLNVQNVPSAVSLVSPSNNATAVPTDTITFTWNSIAGATSYDIRISKNQNFPNGQTNEFNVTSTNYISTTPLNAGTPYYWQVRANNDCGNGNYLTRYQFTTKTTNAIVNIERDHSTPTRQLTRDDHSEDVFPMSFLQKVPIHKESLILLSMQISKEIRNPFTFFAQ